MNESLCPLSPSVCGFYYFTLETVGFQSRLVFHQWIWDPGMTDFDFMNGGMVFFEDLCYFRVEVMKFHFGRIHGEDISGFLLATQNHHEWRIGNVRFSFNTAIWLISLDEGYDSEDIMFTVMNSMVWCSQKAKQEPKAESFVVLSKHNEDIHIAYVDIGSTSYYFAKEIFEHNLEMEFEIWCLKANGQNFATLFDCDGVVLNTNERHFLLVGAKWRILEWKVMKILLYQCQSKSISMP